MRYFNLIKLLLIFCLSTAFLASAAFAEELVPHPNTYLPHPADVSKIIKATDDPTDLMVTYPPKKAVAPEVWKYLQTDVEKAKRMTAEIVGFKAPDIVGKIAPDIKPGKYTYKDVAENPELKDLFPPEFVQHIRPGGPPLIGSVPEFEIIPTRQHYWFARLCEMTQKNLGKTKLDKDGYINSKTWDGGFPFPQPSGKFKAQELYYDFEKRYGTTDFCYALRGEGFSYDRNLTRDNYFQYEGDFTKLKGRALFPPYGWLDERAKKNDEFQSFSSYLHLPRVRRGTVVVQYRYDDPYKNDPWLTYVPSLRRIRKMMATDTQDPSGDATYDDRGILAQKITPERYPYDFEIIGEREYLMPIAWNNTKAWIDSKDGYALKDVQFTRRPCYVLQMTQLDPNYVYSKRILYIDKENFYCDFIANYDQKGRLYRSQMYTVVFMPETGQLYPYGTHTFQWDYVDEHSSFQMQISLPGSFTRKDFQIQSVIKKGK